MLIIKTSKTKLTLLLIMWITIFYLNVLIFFYLFENYIGFSSISFIVSLPIAIMISNYLEKLINYEELNMIDYEHLNHNRTIKEDT